MWEETEMVAQTRTLALAALATALSVAGCGSHPSPTSAGKTTTPTPRPSVSIPCTLTPPAPGKHLATQCKTGSRRNAKRTTLRHAGNASATPRSPRQALRSANR